MNPDSSSIVLDSGQKAPTCPIVSTSFSDYKPRFDPVPIVRRMLESIPEKYLVGLGEVVLTNVGGLPRKRRRSVTTSRGRKVKVIDAGGLYHPASNGRRAWIEIFVDNALRGFERGWWLRIPFSREARLGDVLFHEIGHHIHFTCRPEYREKEDVADVWKVRLGDNYNLHRFRWIAGFGRLIRPFLGPFIKLQTAKVGQRMLQRGQISCAEYEASFSTSKPNNKSVPR